MYTVLLVIHTLLVLFLIGVILIQRSSDDGLSGLGGGGGNVLSGRAAGNMLTRVTAILATIFIITSLALGVMIGGERGRSVLDAAPSPLPLAPSTAPSLETAPAEPVAPVAPKPE